MHSLPAGIKSKRDTLPPRRYGIRRKAIKPADRRWKFGRAIAIAIEFTRIYWNPMLARPRAFLRRIRSFIHSKFIRHARTLGRYYLAPADAASTEFSMRPSRRGTWTISKRPSTLTSEFCKKFNVVMTVTLSAIIFYILSQKRYL